ncbi:MAG: PEP/pyruvate-binding domain-containing protein [Candidatus Hodarchaeota archaeon]
MNLLIKIDTAGMFLEMFEKEPIQKLADVDYSRADTFGERACCLSRLISKGYNVPLGVVVSTKVFKRFLNTIPGTKRIDRLIDEVTPENFEETAQEIQDIIICSPVPMPMANPIAEKIYQLMDSINSETVVVRTSAHVEDSARHICHGRGVYFHLKDIANIIQVIKQCWASAYTSDVLHDLIHAGLPPDNVRIAVIIEEMITAKVSGILSVRSADKNGGIHIRSNWGTKVDGIDDGIYCDHVIVNEQKVGEPIETFTSYKDKISHIPPDNRHAVIVENEPEMKQELSLSMQNVTTLTQLAKKIRQDFEVDYDIEFIFDENGSIWLLDAIPKSRHRSLLRIGKSVNNSINNNR